MKATYVLVLGLSLLAAAVPTKAKVELENIGSPLTPRASSSCEQTLSCTFDQIQQTTMAQRLAYIQAIESKFLSQLNAGNQFRAIEGVITFFQEKGLGAPGTWISYVDSGIVEAIQRGAAIALRMSEETGNNPGS